MEVALTIRPLTYRVTENAPWWHGTTQRLHSARSRASIATPSIEGSRVAIPCHDHANLCTSHAAHVLDLAWNVGNDLFVFSQARPGGNYRALWGKPCAASAMQKGKQGVDASGYQCTTTLVLYAVSMRLLRCTLYVVHCTMGLCSVYVVLCCTAQCFCCTAQSL